jgi:hypothetical protein
MSPLIKTKRQANFKDFKRFGAFGGLVEQKKLYSIRSCVNWVFLARVGQFKTRVKPAPQFTQELVK